MERSGRQIKRENGREINIILKRETETEIETDTETETEIETETETDRQIDS